MRTPIAPYRCLATAALLASTILVPVQAQQRVVDGRVVKSARTLVRPSHESDLIGVKFKDGLSIRVRSGGLDDGGSGALASADAVLADAAAGTWERTHRIDPARLAELVALARSRGAHVPDLDLDVRLHLAPGLDVASAIDSLNALEIVEIAWPIAKPLPPPSAPDFTNLQTYTGLAPQGLGVRASWPRPAATGRRVKVCDIEYQYDPAHLDILPIGLVNSWVAGSFADHGTAVLGQLFAKSDGKGTTGMVPMAEPWISPPTTPGHSYNVAAAITDSLAPPAALDRGDVILIEQQTAGPNFNPPPCCLGGGCLPGVDCQFGLVPIEWDPAVHNAIALAVGLGVHVVEAAGNGSQNLDDPIYGGWFDTLNDSGAIVVGAGAAPSGSTADRSRLSFSNFGTTVDLQGQGEFVATTGYGDLYGGSGSPESYTSVFSGTSSASPMVTAACVLVSSTFEEQTKWPMAPRELRELLRLTGSAQTSGINPSSQNIGPRPNVVTALNELEMWRIGDDDPWTPAPMGGNLPMRDAAFVYDSARGRAVVLSATDLFGNPWPTVSSLYFEYDPDGTNLHEHPGALSAGAIPPPRNGAAGAYDAKRDRYVLFGGNIFGAPLVETSEYDPETGNWYVASMGGPTARSGHSMAYDPVRERVVLVGGDCGGSCSALTWEWDGSTWQSFAGPPDRTDAALAWDSDRSRLVLFGGRSPTTLLDLGDTWERVGTTWVQVSSSGPSARSRAGAAYDTSRRRFVLDGGYQTMSGITLEDTWEWNGLSWRQSTAPLAGYPRSGHSLVYDTVQGRMYTFGGESSPSVLVPALLERNRRYETGAPYCFGDGTGGTCPCGNVTDRFVKTGCVNSQGTGAKLRSIGMASLFHPQPQRPVLQGSDMPNGPALYFQGTAKQNGGFGTVFGDGRLCVTGTTIRLGIKFNVGGASQFPELIDPDLSSPWLISETGTRMYQIWYRDSPTFCTGAGFNLSNALRVVWGL